MARALNFGIVGLGMGGHHALAIKTAKGAQLVAICDTDEERLYPMAKEHDCKAYERYGAMLKDPEIDAVCIVTETGYHATMGVQAARAGKHIIMEKPIDVNPAKMRRFEDAVASAGVKCGCIFQSRMDNCNIMIKRAIDKGRMGRTLGLHGWLPWFRGPDYFAGKHGPWRGTWKLDGGGSMMNQGVHTVDMLLFLGGPVESVFGYYGVFNHDIESEDNVVACLKFANGALGTLFTTTCTVPEGSQLLYGFGTKGSFRKQDEQLEAYDMGPKKERERMMRLFGGKKKGSAIAKDPMAVSEDGHTLIVEDLVKAVRYNREPIIPISTAKQAVELVCAIYKAGRTGREVKVSSISK